MGYKITAFLLFVATFISAEVDAQTVNFEDGFEDGNFSENPEWTGDTNQFTVIDGTPNYLLEVDGDGESSAVSYLSTPSSNVEGSWEFFINLNYNPSDGNRADIFLMSDIENLEGSVNGYAIRAGENGSDDVFRLVRYENGSEAATVLSGSTDISSGGAFRVKVTRESGGEWTLEVAQGYDGQLSSEGTATDNTFDTASYTGVRATYTSTRDDLFTFDYKIDLPPFNVTQSSFNDNQVDITFNRPYDQSTVEASDFSIDNGIGNPSSVTFPNATTVRLDYGNTNFSSGEYTVTVNAVDDQNGETIASNTTSSFDILPFDVTESTINGTQVDITFNRNYDQSTVQASDFSIDNNIGSPGSITFPTTTTVRLDYGSTNFPSDRYTITVNDVGDEDGITVATNTTSTFIIYGTYASGDIIINEFVYDYPPTINEEYIEIRNTSDKYLNLAEWEIADNSSSSGLGSNPISIEPDSFLVISADTTELYNVFGDRAYHESSFPALNNSGNEAVQLITNDGTKADSLTYNSDWGGTDVALERRSASAPSIYKESWGDSPHPDGGTPGMANEVAEDNTPPNFTDLNILSTQTLQLVFDERLDQVGNFGITNNSISSVDQTAADTVELSLGSDLQNDQDYTLSIDNSEDVFGNTIVATDTTFTFYNPSPVDSGDVAINEFAYAPPANSSEYIELYNHSDKSLDLQGWTLSDNRESVEATISGSRFIVPPDSFVVITPDNTIESEYPNIAMLTMGDFPALNNDGDQIIIRDSNGTLLDSLAYTSEWGGDEIALERRTVDAAGAYQSNWGDAPNGFGTPGSANEVEPDQTPPDLTNLNIANNTSIEIGFNEPILQQTLEDPNNYQLAGSIAIDQAAATGEQSVMLTLASALQNAVDYQLTIDGIQDIYSNTLSSRDTTFTFYEISVADSGDVFISEFMSVPPSGSTEYIELRNTTTKSFDLQDWTINDNTGNRQTITTQRLVLPPDSAIVIAPDQTLETDFPAIALIAMGSSFPSLNNSGDNIVVRTGNGTRVDSLQYQSDWGTDEVALERRSFNLSAIYQSNWGDSPNGFGTPGTSNEIDTDSEAPTLENLVVRSNQEILLTLSAYLDETSSEDPSNFTLSGNPSVSNARFAAPDSIFLTLDENLQNARNYTLSIKNVGDLFDNTIPKTDTTFTFYEVSPVDAGDVAINEFMFIPPSGSSEYIELYNHSDKSLDLQGWTLSDNRESVEGTISDNQFIVPPDSFVVITPDNTIESEFPDIALITMSDFPALNNGGDQIIIRDQNGTLLDSLAYTSDWGGDEIALERRTVDVSGIYQSNWGNAPNGFGTPGSTNEIQPDQTPPHLISLNIANNTSIEIGFNEPIEPQSLENTTNYQLSESIGIDQATANTDRSVTLTLATDLQNATKYQLTIDGIQDIYSNTITDRDTTFTYYEISAADSGDVFLSEFMSVPLSGSTEYVELRNTTSKSFDLQGWTINDNTGDWETITDQQQILPPDSAIVIAPDQTLKTDYPDIALIEMGSDFPSLNNNGDNIVIRTTNGIRLDSLQYRGDWGTDEIALERRSFTLSAIYQSNWGDAPNGFGTPGTPNEIDVDSESPTLENVTIRNSEELLLTFSEYLDESSVENITNFSLSGTPSVNNAQFSAPDSILLTLDASLENATGYTLIIENVTDLFSNAIAQTDTAFTFYEVSPVDSGDVAINEFLYVPPSNSSEFIELYNHSDKSLDLQGWTLSDNRESFEGTISDDQFVIPPDSFAVIAPDNTIESEFPGIALVTMSDFPALNNGGDQIIIRDQNGTLLDSLAYTSEWGGDETALERRTVDAAGAYQSNWGDSPNGFGTPGSANEITPDDTPPELASFTIESRDLLSITFSERTSRTTVEDLSNYTLSGNLDIASISFVAPDSAFLQLDSNLQNAVNYTLSIQNVTDIFGNTIAPIDTSFTYYETTPADSGDVFVNEFSFLPPSGSTEFIELYNPTDESFDLQGWTLSDNRGIRSTITESQFVVPPDSFVVIAPDNTVKTEHPNIALVTMSSFPALNNSGDDIIIRNENGAVLDSLRFTSYWGGDEVAVERRTTTVSATFHENWGDAPNGFGTPGSQNNIPQDQTPPSLENLISINNKVELTFSEKVTPSSATDKQNYQLSPSTGIQLISAQDKTITLFLEQELTDGQTYEITISNISDIFGNTLSSATREFEYLQIDDAQAGQIVINEILYNPGNGGKADFIELYNTTDKNFDLTEWVIGDFSTNTTIQKPLQLEAGKYIVLTGNQNFAAEIPNGIAISGFPALNNNTSDDIYIRNQNSVTIDSLRYYQNWGGNTDGSSLERKDPLGASNDASNWQTNNSNNGISAGAQNITFQEDVNPPEIIFSKVLADGTFEVRFNEFIRLTDNVAFYAGEERLSIAYFDSTNANVIFLSSPTSKSNNISANSTTIRAENLSDVKGNTTTSSDISVAQPLQNGDLVINEIMFNPLSDSDDNQPDQTEYIELRNTQEYAISLEGLFLHDEPDENGDIRDIQPVSTTAKWVPPGGQVLIHADEATDFEESLTASFFDLESPSMQSIMRADRSSLSLASSDDAIFIADSAGATIDSVFYDESWHNPNIIDTRGIALERIAPDGPSNDESNWGSSVTEKGGTPNSENSIYQENGDLSQETGISFNPNPFSPDDDGHEDNLFINYKLDQPDYLIKVRIFDRYGRLVRTLADNKQAGFEGQLIWDGRKDDNSRNRIGIYIVVFEAYDSASGSDLNFKKTVVLARQLN